MQGLSGKNRLTSGQQELNLKYRNGTRKNSKGKTIDAQLGLSDTEDEARQQTAPLPLPAQVGLPFLRVFHS